MHKRLSLILVVLSLLVALVGVAAAPTASGVVKLVGLQYVPNKGPVFTFETSGKFSRSDLMGTVRVQGAGSYSLHCTKVDENTAKCSASQKVAAVNAAVNFGGSTFWTYIPGVPPESEHPDYCYTIYDYDLGFVWRAYSAHCQGTPAEYEDVITYYNPDWDGDYEVMFMPAGPSCSGILGDAYYYPECEYVEGFN